MANSKREKLESRAAELGLVFVPSTTDEELQDLITNFENPGNPPTPPEEKHWIKYYKTNIPGLSIHLSSDEERDEQPEKLRFEAREYFDEEKGDHYTIGILETDDTEAQEILSEDHNVVEIKKKDYEELVKTGKLARI